VAAVIYDENDQLLELCSRATNALDSYQAEAQAVLEVLGWMLEQVDRARWVGATVVLEQIASPWCRQLWKII
jgi:hypothetical protein